MRFWGLGPGFRACGRIKVDCLRFGVQGCGFTVMANSRGQYCGYLLPVEVLNSMLTSRWGIQWWMPAYFERGRQNSTTTTSLCANVAQSINHYYTGQSCFLGLLLSKLK